MIKEEQIPIFEIKFGDINLQFPDNREDLEIAMKLLQEKLSWFDQSSEGNSHLENIIESIKKLLIDVCEDYDTENCQEGICDCDPNGWEGCLTRKILQICSDIRISEVSET